MSTGRAFLGQFGWVAASRVVGAVLQAVLLVFAARSLTVGEFGSLSAVLGLALVLMQLVDLGISTYIVRYRAARTDDPTVEVALHIHFICSLALAAISAALLVWLGVFVSSFFFQLLPLALWAAAERDADVHTSVAFADGDAWVQGTNLVVRRSVAVLLLLALSAFSVTGGLSYSIAVSLAAVGSAVTARIWIRGRLVATPLRGAWRAVIRESRHYWLNSAATQARNLDSAVVVLVAGPTAGGLYSAASRLLSPLRLISTSMASAILPATTRAAARGESLRHVYLASVGTLAMMTVVGAAVAVTAPWAVPLLLGEDYAPAATAVMIVAIGLPFAALASMSGAVLQGLDHRRSVGFTALGTTFWCLAAVAIGAWIGGADAAAWGLSSSFVVQSAALLIIVRLVRSKQ